MGVSVICREARREDLPHILRLYAQPELDDGKVLSLVEAERIFERVGSYPEYKVYVAECEGRILGTYALLVMDNLAHRGAPSGVVEDVAVDPAWQGRGVGKSMMRHALNLCTAKGCYKLTLSANAKRQSAHAFYESLGFERHGYSFKVVPLIAPRPPQAGEGAGGVSQSASFAPPEPAGLARPAVGPKAGGEG